MTEISAAEVREVTELITPGPAQALAGLLGVPPADAGLPLLWHWVYLLDRPPQAVLGADGHPARDAIPTPPGPGLRRMFAGGRVSQHGPLRTGTEATRRTWQASSSLKRGRSGPLHFVTVRTEISQGGEVVITEEQDLVYREPAPSSVPAATPDIQPPPPGPGDWRVEVNPVLLFRFSALTYNAHRIHYDRDYARGEGYPGLLVHGPLQALLMAEQARPKLPPRRDYSYRLVAPLFDDQGLIVAAAEEEGGVQVTARDGTGRTTATGVISARLSVPGRHESPWTARPNASYWSREARIASDWALRRLAMAINDRTRASDADRDRTTAALQEHLVAGRLTKDEFDERLGQVYAAKTLGELDEVMADLPAADFGQLPGASLRPSADRLPPARSSPAWRAAWGSWLSISLFVFVIWLIGGASVSLWFVWAAAAAGALMLGRWSTDAPARSERRSARHGHDHR